MQDTKIEIRARNCKATFSAIAPICGDIRVEGWISAPSKDEGFEFSRYVGTFIGRQSIGGFCWDEEGPVLFPFSFDEPKQLNRFYNRESTYEAVERITKSLRKAKRAINAENK